MGQELTILRSVWRYRSLIHLLEEEDKYILTYLSVWSYDMEVILDKISNQTSLIDSL